MKKIIGIFMLCFLITGCTEENGSARARIAVKNAKSIIRTIKLEYILDSSNIPIGKPVDILSIKGSEVNVLSGTYTILSEEASSNESLIRLDNAVINDHICSGTKDDIVCTPQIKTE